MATVDYSADIALVSIDTENLEDVEDNPEAVKFCVELNQTPTEIWIQEFEQAYRSTPFVIKPPMQVMEKNLEIVYLPRYAPELREFFHFLKSMTARANKETHRTEEIHAAGHRETRKNELRDALREIKL